MACDIALTQWILDWSWFYAYFVCWHGKYLIWLLMLLCCLTKWHWWLLTTEGRTIEEVICKGASFPPPTRDRVGCSEPNCSAFFSESCPSSFLDFFFLFFFFRDLERAAKFRRALEDLWTLQVWDISLGVTILICQELKWAERWESAHIKSQWLLFGNQSY